MLAPLEKHATAGSSHKNGDRSVHIRNGVSDCSHHIDFCSDMSHLYSMVVNPTSSVLDENSKH